MIHKLFQSVCFTWCLNEPPPVSNFHEIEVMCALFVNKLHGIHHDMFFYRSHIAVTVMFINQRG